MLNVLLVESLYCLTHASTHFLQISRSSSGVSRSSTQKRYLVFVRPLQSTNLHSSNLPLHPGCKNGHWLTWHESAQFPSLDNYGKCQNSPCIPLWEYYITNSKEEYWDVPSVFALYPNRGGGGWYISSRWSSTYTFKPSVRTSFSYFLGTYLAFR